MKISFYSYIFIFLLFLAKGSTAQTQQLKFDLITGTNGISLGKINGMTRDKFGFMWFADQSNHCIIRYDGRHMTRYPNDPKNPNSLGGYHPECLFADTDGNIWIGFYGTGLDKFDPATNTFTHYRHQENLPESLSDDFVSAILIDHLGNIWVGTYGGLNLLDQKTGKFKHYRYNANDSTSLSNNKVRAIYEDKAGELWIGTGFAWDDEDSGGLNHFNRKTGSFTRYLSDPKNPQSIINNKVRCIFEDSKGNFWIGTKGDGLHTLDRKTGLFTRLTYNPAKPEQLSRPALVGEDDHITFITEDAVENIWIGTVANGINRYDPKLKKIIHFGTNTDKSGAFKDNSGWWANVSADGLIWISTQEANLYKIDVFKNFIPHFGNKSSDGVTSFCEETESVFWYGTRNGLFRKEFKNGTTRQFVHDPRIPTSLSDNFVNSIIKDQQGYFWIGTDEGLNQLNPTSKIFKRYQHDPKNNSSLSENFVTVIYEDRDSTIWVITENEGLNRLNHKTGEFIHYLNIPYDTNSISSNLLSAILEDDSTNLWIGTYNNSGLTKMNRQTGKFKHYLPGITINTIYKDSGGFIWLGTPGGLLKYDRKSDDFYPGQEEDAVIDIVNVSSIIEDNENNLWVSSSNGIYKLNQKRNNIILYGKESGVLGDYNFFNNAVYKRRGGELYFGNSNGYYAFYPDSLNIIPGATLIYFTNFWLNSQEIKPGKYGPLRKSLLNAKEILLNHDQNVFSFSCTAIDFRNPGNKKIYYKLENHDKDWRLSDVEDRIHYFKVPPGKYILRIKTSNSNNGEWTEKSIDVVITPPWWRTWWACGIYGLIFIAFAYSIHHFQKKQVIKVERERTRERELAQAKEIEKAYQELKITQAQLIQSEKMASLGELTAGIAHEIQNPLNFVNNFSEVNAELIDELNAELAIGNTQLAKEIAGNIRENEEKIIFHGKRADAIVKGMLQHSRSSSGVKEPTDIHALTDEYLRLAYHGLRAKNKSFNVTMKTDYDPAIGLINIIPQDIGRVILNLITNACYTVSEKKKQQPDYEPTVEVITRKLNDKIEIRVRDNGNGIPQHVVDKIFQPFFTTKPTGQGTGLGLSLSYDIVKAHGGEIRVDAVESERTEFIILIPINLS